MEEASQACIKNYWCILGMAKYPAAKCISNHRRLSSKFSA